MGKRKRKTKMVNGLQVGETFSPKERPSFNEWVKEMGISEASYQEGDGRVRAQELMRHCGIDRPLTFIEFLLGVDGRPVPKHKQKSDGNEG